MEKDLKWIKKHYGENMMHLCRSNLSRLLETEGLVPKLLSQHFQPCKSLAQDLIDQDLIDQFKSFMFSFVDVEKINATIIEEKTAVELMDEAGYILYPECLTEEDVQKFKKFYSHGEDLCTFKGGRLNSCRVWFAVKKDVQNYIRDNFTDPKRQDGYGTSVISIQFSKGKFNTLSIKNRYNHTVNNPDNTFNSNLDNIIEGLSDAFERDYNVRDYVSEQRNFEIDGYVNCQGKYFKYNHEIDNIYYCPNNIIIENFVAKKLPEHQMLIDYFVFDLQNNTIELYDAGIPDSFVSSIQAIQQITFKENVLTVKTDSGEVLIGINDNREIVSLKNENLTLCHSYYLSKNKALKELSMDSLETCMDAFLEHNIGLKKVSLPNLKQVGDNFLSLNVEINEVDLAALKECGRNFLYNNIKLTNLCLPGLQKCGNHFLRRNLVLSELQLPNLLICKDAFLYRNEKLKKLSLPKLDECGDYFLGENEIIDEVNLPNLVACGSGFLRKNQELKSLNLPYLKACGNTFLYKNEIMETLNVPQLVTCGKMFMRHNFALNKFNAPNLGLDLETVKRL